MPEPVLLAIAAALASKSAGGLYDLVRNRFRGQPPAEAALEAAAGAAPEAPEVQALVGKLQSAVDADPDFGEQLRAAWRAASASQAADQGGVANLVTGPVSGTVVQARDVHGGITLGGPQ